MFEVRCATCQRVEVWDGAPPACVSVRLEGGARKPSEHPAVAAWKTLVGAQGRGATVLGPCAACGQPLVTEARGVAPLAYVIDLPGPDVRFEGRAFVGPAGAIPADEARRRIDAALPPPPPIEVGRVVFTGYVAGLGGVALVMWLAAATFVLFFLIRGAQTGALWGQRGSGVYEADLPQP